MDIVLLRMNTVPRIRLPKGIPSPVLLSKEIGWKRGLTHFVSRNLLTRQGVKTVHYIVPGSNLRTYIFRLLLGTRNYEFRHKASPALNGEGGEK